MSMKYISIRNYSKRLIPHHLNLHLTPLLPKVRRIVVVVISLLQINLVHQSYKSKLLASLTININIVKKMLKSV